MPNYVSQTQASEKLTSANRILVIGCSGGGKTTLSTAIASKLNMEYLSIDRDVRWLPGWNARDRQSQRTTIAELVKRPRWVMDGSGASTFDLRVPRSDLILWIRVSRFTALKGLALRVFRNFGYVRSHMAEGCPEKLPDLEFLLYIWNFEKKHAPAFIKNIDKYGPNIPLAVFETHAEIAQMLRNAFKPSATTTRKRNCD